MTDIVERLRHHAIRGDSPIADEAADEIERLRRHADALAEALEKISRNEDEVFDEDTNDLVIVGFSAEEMQDIASTALAAAEAQIEGRPAGARWGLGDMVQKKRGSSWRGKVVGFYSTDHTPIGYAVDSIYEPGSVQVWPEAALEPYSGEHNNG